MYNGHPSKAAWNVAQWIAGDEGLYRLAVSAIANTTNREAAARRFMEMLGDMTHTPDGVRWTVTNVRRAMVGM